MTNTESPVFCACNHANVVLRSKIHDSGGQRRKKKPPPYSQTQSPREMFGPKLHHSFGTVNIGLHVPSCLQCKSTISNAYDFFIEFYSTIGKPINRIKSQFLIEKIRNCVKKLETTLTYLNFF